MVVVDVLVGVVETRAYVKWKKENLIAFYSSIICIMRPIEVYGKKMDGWMTDYRPIVGLLNRLLAEYSVVSGV